MIICAQFEKYLCQRHESTSPCSYAYLVGQLDSINLIKLHILDHSIKDKVRDLVLLLVPWSLLKTVPGHSIALAKPSNKITHYDKPTIKWVLWNVYVPLTVCFYNILLSRWLCANKPHQPKFKATYQQYRRSVYDIVTRRKSEILKPPLFHVESRWHRAEASILPVDETLLPLFITKFTELIWYQVTTWTAGVSPIN